MLLCALTCSDMLPAEQVKSAQVAIQAGGIQIVPQLLCPLIVPGTPGQDDIIVEMGTSNLVLPCVCLSVPAARDTQVLCCLQERNSLSFLSTISQDPWHAALLHL